VPRLRVRIDVFACRSPYGCAREFRLNELALHAPIAAAERLEAISDALPSFSVENKRRAPRHDWFKRNYGDRVWGFDTTNPNALRAGWRTAILARLDHAAWAPCQTIEAIERESRLRDTVDEALSDVLRSIDVAPLADDRDDVRAVALALNQGKGRDIETMLAAITLVDGEP
jgi:hypothetical protein